MSETIGRDGVGVQSVQGFPLVYLYYRSKKDIHGLFRLYWNNCIESHKKFCLLNAQILKLARKLSVKNWFSDNNRDKGKVK